MTLSPTDQVAALDLAASRHATPCGDGEMVWRSWGEGPPLVLLHGDAGAWTHWLRCIPALARHHRVIAPDLPGYGCSASPPEGWDAAGLAGILATGLARLLPSPMRYHLAGFSFGGIIAGHLAAWEGARVAGLALLGPGGLGLPRGPLPPLRRLAREMAPAEVAAVHRHNLAALMLADPAAVDALALELQRRNTSRARLRTGDIPTSDSLARVLPRVVAPVLGLWGEHDAFGQPVRDRQVVLRRLLPALDFQVIPGAGHWTPHEAPARVTAALLGMSGARASA